MRMERQVGDDFVENQLRDMRKDADMVQRDTNRALDRLNQISSEIEMKNRQN